MEPVDARSDVRLRVIEAAPADVFAALADPARVARWWGPAGFSSTIHEFDFRVGGRWRLTMHGPDGQDYPNESLFTRIEPDRAVQIEHLSGHHFLLTIELAPAGQGTQLHWRQTFDTVDHYQRIAEFVAQANEQNLDKLADEVARGKPRSAPTIRDLRPGEARALGELMVQVYAALPGFPSPEQQPAYYRMLGNIAAFAERPGARVLVALSPDDRLLGGVVYFGDMAHYGSGGAATQERDAAGIRLLGVDPRFRGSGAGRALTEACIALARESGRAQVILHTTKAMQTAWGLYDRLGFTRSADLDFLQQDLPVFGFRLKLR